MLFTAQRYAKARAKARKSVLFGWPSRAASCVRGTRIRNPAESGRSSCGSAPGRGAGFRRNGGTERLTGFSIRLTGIPVARTVFVITRPHPAGPHWKGPPSGLRTGWRPFLQLCHAGRHDTRGHAFTKLPCGVMRTRRSRSVRSSSTSKTYHSPDGVSA